MVDDGNGIAVNQPHIMLAGGVRMPQLGLGLWQTPAEETAGIVRAAIAAGYRAVDTAMIYGNEAGVGEALAEHPDIFVTTKLWNDDQGYDRTLRAFDASAKRLQRDIIDLYLIHWPVPGKGLYVESWKALVRLKQEGRVRAIGVSNFNQKHLGRIVAETGETPVLNQVELHPHFQQKAARAFHAEQGIWTESWSPLGQGKLLADATLAKIAARYGKTPAQAIIRWHLDSGLIVIPKSVRTPRMAENIDVFDFCLDAQDIDAIAALDMVDGRIGPDPATAFH